MRSPFARKLWLLAAATVTKARVEERLCNSSRVASALRRVVNPTMARVTMEMYRNHVLPHCPVSPRTRVPLLVVGRDLAQLACVADYVLNLAVSESIDESPDVVLLDRRRRRGNASTFLATLAAADRVLLASSPQQAMIESGLRRRRRRRLEEVLRIALARAATDDEEEEEEKGTTMIEDAVEDHFFSKNNEDRRRRLARNERVCSAEVRKERALLSRAYDVGRDKKRATEDVGLFYGTSANELHHCDAKSSMAIPGCTYVVEGAVVHAHARGAGVKQALMDLVLRSVVPLSLTNVSFYLDLRATGVKAKKRPHKGRKGWRLAPVFSIAQKGGSVVAAPAALAPSPYFLNPRWWFNYTKEFLHLASERPWRSRRKAVLFRGGCGPGAAERIKLLHAFSHNASSVVDFRLVSYIGNFSSLDDCMSSVARATLLGFDESDAARLRARVGPKMPLAQYSRYRYLLHMPGAATGSYSRNLQHLFMHGAVVLIWDSPASEWYYHLLRDRVHYARVNASTLLETVRDIEANRTLRRTLVAGGRYVATRLLSPNFIHGRWRALLDPLFTKQRRTPFRLPSTACSCDPRFPRCAFCDVSDKYDRLFRSGQRKKLAWV